MTGSDCNLTKGSKRESCLPEIVEVTTEHSKPLAIARIRNLSAGCETLGIVTTSTGSMADDWKAIDV